MKKNTTRFSLTSGKYFKSKYCSLVGRSFDNDWSRFFNEQLEMFCLGSEQKQSLSSRSLRKRVTEKRNSINMSLYLHGLRRRDYVENVVLRSKSYLPNSNIPIISANMNRKQSYLLLFSISSAQINSILQLGTIEKFKIGNYRKERKCSKCHGSRGAEVTY